MQINMCHARHLIWPCVSLHIEFKRFLHTEHIMGWLYAYGALKCKSLTQKLFLNDFTTGWSWDVVTIFKHYYHISGQNILSLTVGCHTAKTHFLHGMETMSEPLESLQDTVRTRPVQCARSYTLVRTGFSGQDWNI